MREKGFTLIELLAVIVILAIIALIATPIILGIIEDASDEAIERGVENYLKAVNIAVAKQNLNEEFDPISCIVKENEKEKLVCTLKNGTQKEITIEIDGKYPKEGTITFKNGNVEGYSNLKMEENKYANKGSNGVEINAIPKVCTIIKQDSSKYSKGDVVTCKLSESTDKFYVIEDTPLASSTLNMLTDKNINVTTYRQSDNAGKVSFSSTNYWKGEDNYTIDISKCEEKGNFCFTSNNEENDKVKPIVDNYMNYLNISLPDATGSLLSFDQAQYKLFTACVDEESCSSIPSWIIKTSYWTGSAFDETEVFYVDIDLTMSPVYLYPNTYSSTAGVRPVITMQTSDIG